MSGVALDTTVVGWARLAASGTQDGPTFGTPSGPQVGHSVANRASLNRRSPRAACNQMAPKMTTTHSGAWRPKYREFERGLREEGSYPSATLWSGGQES
jgi:hypothetical protein